MLSSNSEIKAIRFYQGMNRADVAAHELQQHRAMLHQLRYLIPAWALTIADAIGEKWLSDNISPYKTETASMAQTIAAGIYTLNTGFEWGCTTRVSPDPQTGLPVIYRTLDWGLPIGRFMHMAEYETACGNYIDINWAGNAGIINAIAPGRFCIAINQAPIPMRSKLGDAGVLFDWIIQRIMTYHSRNWAPSHLLRHVFETAPDYQTARRMLIESKLAIPAIFTLCGSQKGEYCVIERMENDAFVIDKGEICTTNHWQNPKWRGHARPIKSKQRLLAAKKNKADGLQGWLTNPVLNRHSIMAFQSDAKGIMDIVILAGKQTPQPYKRYTSN